MSEASVEADDGGPASEASKSTLDWLRIALKHYPTTALFPLVKRRITSTVKHHTQPEWAELNPYERAKNFHHIMAAAGSLGFVHSTLNLNLSYDVERRVCVATDTTDYAYRLLKRYLGDIDIHLYIFVEDGPVDSTTEIHKRASLGLDPNMKRHVHGEMSFSPGDLPRVVAALCAAGGDDVPKQLNIKRRPNSYWLRYAAKDGRRYAVTSGLRRLAEDRYTDWRVSENVRRAKKAALKLTGKK